MFYREQYTRVEEVADFYRRGCGGLLTQVCRAEPPCADSMLVFDHGPKGWRWGGAGGRAWMDGVRGGSILMGIF